MLIPESNLRCKSEIPGRAEVEPEVRPGPGTEKRAFTRLPVILQGAEYLVMGHLMRRNILTYKAPSNNGGYDLTCMHPDPRVNGPTLRIQVKSCLATDCDRGFPVKGKTLDAFDYLIVVFLNVGYFFSRAKKHCSRDGHQEPEFYTMPAGFIRTHHNASNSWEKVRTRGLNLEPYKDDAGFELTAQALQIPYPEKTNFNTTLS
jgi:hypothetical protein